MQGERSNVLRRCDTIGAAIDSKYALRSISTFTQRRNSRQHFFVQNAHVPTRFFITGTYLLPDDGKFTAHLLAQVHDLQLQCLGSRGQHG